MTDNTYKVNIVPRYLRGTVDYNLGPETGVTKLISFEKGITLIPHISLSIEEEFPEIQGLPVNVSYNSVSNEGFTLAITNYYNKNKIGKVNWIAFL